MSQLHLEELVRQELGPDAPYIKAYNAYASVPCSDWSQVRDCGSGGVADKARDDPGTVVSVEARDDPGTVVAEDVDDAEIFSNTDEVMPMDDHATEPGEAMVDAATKAMVDSETIVHDSKADPETSVGQAKDHDASGAQEPETSGPPKDPG